MYVLIIEDFQDIDSGLRHYLETKGHTVDVVGGSIFGRNSLTWISQYDAIVLDLMASEMNGIALCRKLREEGCKVTPILMISAFHSLDEKLAGLVAGADDLLLKSATPREIEARLRVLLRLRSGAKVRTS
jgi:DNA-binding response OmpR family regulator